MIRVEKGEGDVAKLAQLVKLLLIVKTLVSLSNINCLHKYNSTLLNKTNRKINWKQANV
jgi:hypothetical protein